VVYVALKKEKLPFDIAFQRYKGDFLHMAAVEGVDGMYAMVDELLMMYVDRRVEEAGMVEVEVKRSTPTLSSYDFQIYLYLETKTLSEGHMVVASETFES
jgi:hypothetical protein